MLRMGVALLVIEEHDNEWQGPSNSSATKPGPSGMPTPSRQNGEAGFSGRNDSADMLIVVPGNRPGAHDAPPRPESPPKLMSLDHHPPPLPDEYVLEYEIVGRTQV